MKKILPATIASLWLTWTPNVVANTILTPIQQTQNNVARSTHNTLTQNQSVEQILQTEMMKIQQIREQFKTNKSIISEYQKNIKNFKGLLHKSHKNIKPEILKKFEEELREEELYLGAFEYFLSPENVTTIGNKNTKRKITFLGQTHDTPEQDTTFAMTIFSQKILKIYLEYFARNSTIAIEWVSTWKTVTERGIIESFMSYFIRQGKVSQTGKINDPKVASNIKLSYNKQEAINFFGKQIVSTHPSYWDYVGVNYLLNNSHESWDDIANLLWGYISLYYSENRKIIWIETMPTVHKNEQEKSFDYTDMIKTQKAFDAFLKNAIHNCPDESIKFANFKSFKNTSGIKINTIEGINRTFQVLKTGNTTEDAILKERMIQDHKMIGEIREKAVVKNLDNIQENDIALVYGINHKHPFEKLFQEEINKSPNKYHIQSISVSVYNNPILEVLFHKYYQFNINAMKDFMRVRNFNQKNKNFMDSINRCLNSNNK